MHSLKYYLRKFTAADLTLCLLVMVIGLLSWASQVPKSLPSNESSATKKPEKPSSVSTATPPQGNVAPAKKNGGRGTAKASTSPRATAALPVADLNLPCANGFERNIRGNCPNIPLCPKRCYLGLPSSKPKACGYSNDKSPSVYEMYSKQKVNGHMCAWTFAPGEP